MFTSTLFAAATAATLSASGLAGRAVVFKAALSNASDRTASAYLSLRQSDAAGKDLPDSVVDPRLISGMFPAGFNATFEERGRVHPAAHTIRLVIDGKDAKLFSVKDVSLEHGAAPAYDPSFFVPGVSGKEKDKALALGGGTAFYFPTQSQACWVEGKTATEESATYYPFGAGTVEAWFRPDWKAFIAAGGGRERVATLFEAKCDQRLSNAFPGRGVRLCLTYDTSKETFSFTLRDNAKGEFTAAAKAPFPDGCWTHLALQWNPGASASLYVGGRKVAEAGLKGYSVYEATKATPRESSDRWVAEFHLGSSYNASRFQATVPESDPLFEGAADALRISSGVRYGRDFTPAAEFRCDAATRALFVFNGFFDGVSAGGARVIPGTVRANRGIMAGSIRDLPPESLRHAFDLLNYRNLPSEDEFKTKWSRTVRSFDLVDGGTASFVASDKSVPDYVEIENRSGNPLLLPAVIGKGEVDPRSFSDMARTFRTWGSNDRERADRVFQWLIGAVGYHSNRTVAYPAGGGKAGDMEYNALLMLNGYCAFECGPMNSLAAQVFASSAGLPANPVAGYSHVFEHVYVDGRFRVYDLCARRYFPDFLTGAPAAVTDLDRESGIHHRLAACSADFGASPAPFVRMGLRSHYAHNPQKDERVGISLNPGERFRMWRGNDGHPNDLQMRNGKPERVDRFFPDYANGFIVFDGMPSKGNPAFTAFKGNSFTYSVKSGYPIVSGRYSAVRGDGTVAPVSLSYDRGKTFVRASEGAVLVDEVLARHEYLVRVHADVGKIVRFRAVTEVQANPRVFTGFPRPGRNDMVFTSAGGDAAHVSFAWREPTSRPLKTVGGVFSGAVPGFAHRLVLGDVSPTAPCLLAHSENGTVTLSCPGAILLSDRDGMDFKGKIPDGSYAVMVCNRFPARVKGRASSRNLLIRDPKSGKAIRFTGARSPTYEYTFDDYGPAEGRGRFKWDFLPQADGTLQTFEFSGADRVSFSSTSPADEPIELAAVLLVPAPVGRELSCALVKTLCGLATVPGRVRAGGGRKLFFAGDSLLQHYEENAPNGSWGEALSPWLDSDVEVVNLAIGGRSTKSFIDEGRWTNLVSRISAGDFVLVSFGSNDQADRPALHTEPEGEYRSNLVRFVRDVRSRGAVPMLTTPLTRRNFLKDGRLGDQGILAYAAAMKKVAEEEKVPLVDMNALSRRLVETVGPDAALGLYAPNDGTHPSKAGAYRYASLFVNEVFRLRPPILTLFGVRK